MIDICSFVLNNKYLLWFTISFFELLFLDLAQICSQKGAATVLLDILRYVEWLTFYLVP